MYWILAGPLYTTVLTPLLIYTITTVLLIITIATTELHVLSDTAMLLNFGTFQCLDQCYSLNVNFGGQCTSYLTIYTILWYSTTLNFAYSVYFLNHSRARCPFKLHNFVYKLVNLPLFFKPSLLNEA